MTDDDAAGDGASASLAGDLWGGLAASLVVLPSSIAFGVVVYTALGPAFAGDGARAGILGAVALGLVAPLVSRNGGFVTAPCAPAAAVMSALAAGLVADGALAPERAKGLMALTALLAAGLQIVFGALRAGRLIKYIPYQVVTGYLSGVAVIIALGQLPRLLGLPASSGLLAGLLTPSQWRWPGVAVGVVTIAVMLLAPRIVKLVPAAILGLVAGLATYGLAAAVLPELRQLADNALLIGRLDVAGLTFDVVAERARGVFQADARDIGLVLGSALTLAALLSIDTLKTGVVLDALSRRRHDSNREIVGQGAANAASFLVGGMPGAGTMGPTLVNFSSGGRSLRSGVASALFVLLALLLLGRFVAWIPIGALAGILLVIAWRMFDRSIFRLALQRSTRLDFGVIAAVIVVAAGVGLIQAAAVGVGLAILLFIRDRADVSPVLSRHDVGHVPSKRRRLLGAQELLAAHADQGVVVQLHGDLFFGTTDRLFTELEPDLRRARYLLLDLRRVHSLDYTAAQLLAQMRARLEQRGGRLLFCGMPSQGASEIEHYLSELGLVGPSGAAVFELRDAAIEWVEDALLEEHGWTSPTEEAPLALEEIELVAGFEPDLQRLLSRAAVAREHAAGERLFARGDPGDELLLVRSGRLRLLMPLPGGRRHHLATIGAGDFFGEMSFVDRKPRSADAEAVTPVSLYAISRSALDGVAGDTPALRAALFERLARAVAKRLRTADLELRLLEDR